MHRLQIRLFPWQKSNDFAQSINWLTSCDKNELILLGQYVDYTLTYFFHKDLLTMYSRSVGCRFASSNKDQLILHSLHVDCRFNSSCNKDRLVLYSRSVDCSFVSSSDRDQLILYGWWMERRFVFLSDNDLLILESRYFAASTAESMWQQLRPYLW